MKPPQTCEFMSLEIKLDRDLTTAFPIAARHVELGLPSTPSHLIATSSHIDFED